MIEIKRKIEVIATREIVRRSFPVKMPTRDSNLFAHEIEKKLPETFLAEMGPLFVFPNGYLATAGALVPARNSFSSPMGIFGAIKTAIKLLLLRLRVTKSAQVKGLAFFPCDEHSNGFFHWLGDVLPRIELFAKIHGSDALKPLTVVVPAMANFPYVMPSLEPYGIGSITILGTSQKVRVDLLATMTPVAPTGNYRPEIMDSIRNRYRKWFAQDAKPELRVFISRAKASRRNIVAEEKLWPYLEQSGFEIVFIENMDFASQVRMAARATILAGLHGAGLSHMLWMQPGTSVLEIRFAGDDMNNCYFSLASALNLNYHYILAESDNPGASSQDANGIVEIEDLQKAITSISER